MKSVIFCVLLGNLLSPLIACAGEVTLAIGQQHSLKVLPGIRFSVGNPQVIRVKATQSKTGQGVLLVRALAQGFSDLVLFEPEGERRLSFRVHAKRSGAQLRETQRLIGSMPGVHLIPQAGRWLVSGKPRKLRDYNLIRRLADRGESRLYADIRLSRDLRQRAQTRIAAVLRDAGIETVSVRGAGERLWLAGEVFSAAAAATALALARDVLQTAESRIKVVFERGEVLRFRIHILELRRMRSSRTGLQWSQSIPRILAIHKQILRSDFSLESTLNFLAQRGYARILSRPEVIVNEAGVAELNVGGEIPIRLRSRKRQTVEWKPYGLHLRVEVPAAGKDLVRARLSVAVSSLDQANAIDGIPALTHNKMETQVDLSRTRTVFLSGLLQSERSTTVNQLPLLGDIPVLGALFRSKDFQQRRSELVIAVTALNPQDAQ